MKSFDEFFEENFEDGLSDPSKYILKFTFETGQQSKQAEVDELQNKIDEALKLLNLAYPESWAYCVDEAINILKGNKDEN